MDFLQSNTYLIMTVSIIFIKDELDDLYFAIRVTKNPFK